MSREEKFMLLFDRVVEIQNLGNYASIEYMNYGFNTIIHAMEGGFEPGKKYVISQSFDIENQEGFEIVFAELNQFIGRFKEKEMTLEEIEEVLGHKVKIVGGHTNG